MGKFIALAALIAFTGGAALAGPKNKAKPAAKLTEVTVCPIMGTKVVGAGGGTTTFKNYRVHFCCSGCKPAFNTLTDAEKERKIQIALKKQKRS